MGIYVLNRQELVNAFPSHDRNFQNQIKYVCREANRIDKIKSSFDFVHHAFWMQSLVNQCLTSILSSVARETIHLITLVMLRLPASGSITIRPPTSHTDSASGKNSSV